MDWIQWYYLVILVLGIVLALFMHGDPKEGYHDFRVDFIALVFSLPIMGRIFGWW